MRMPQTPAASSAVCKSRTTETDECHGLPAFCRAKGGHGCGVRHHNAEVGEASAREMVSEVALMGGTDGQEDLAVELALKVAELVERIAIEEGLAAVDIADVLLLD